MKNRKIKSRKRKQRSAKEERFFRLKKRIGVVSILVTGILVFLIGKVGYIALVKGEEYEREVYSRMVSTEKEIKALRGKIVDTNHKAIANSELVYHIILDPKALLDKKITDTARQKTYTVLAEYLGNTPAEIEQIAKDNSESHYKIMKKSIPAEDMEMLKEKDILGVWFEESFIRTYPKDELAAQVLGFYNGSQGQYGIEQYYDDYLQGRNGRVFPKIQDGNIMITDIVPAQMGNTVVLTIDEVIQQYVEQTMEKYIAEHNPIRASAIVMNPNTGEIYSMYASPGFNPNTYATLEEQMGADKWASLSQEQKTEELGKVWTNFNTQYPYEPGSTFKPMIVAAALEEGIINTNEVYNCTGNNMVGGHNIRCWKRSGHGLQTLEQALANSCNTAVIEIAAKMPTDMFYDYMVRFGLGHPTGIDLPAEASGLIHSMNNLGPVEKATASMGQGFTLTPIQLMTAFSSVINGGKLVTPYVVSQVIDGEGRIVMETETDVKRQVVSEETSQLITEYLQSVVTYGTGTPAALDGYSVGGKTGTAQKLPREDGKHIYSFVGYAPLEDPEVIVLTLFDEIEDGTGAPARAFAEIMDSVLPHLGVETSETPDTLETGRATTPSIEGLDLYKGIESLYAENLDYEIIGVGTNIVSQYPKAGTKLPEGMQVKIYLETQNPEDIQEVPTLTGMTIQDASKIVEGFFVLEGPDSGVIQTQIPKPGTKVERNSKIIVQTSE